jgi:hypothetical protein
MGLFPDIQFHPIDLAEIEKTAELLAQINPTIIVNATTMQSWWVVNELSAKIRERLYRDKCGMGPWTAMHLALSSRLMKAVTMSTINTYVINASYPDVVNPSLARVGLAPTVGIGNLDLAIPYIQKTTSELLNVSMRNVKVELIAHHYHAYVTKAIIEMLQIFTDFDYRANGVTMKDLGMDGFTTKEQIMSYVTYGDVS